MIYFIGTRLGPVEDVLATLLPCGGGERGRVGARAGLRQAVGAQLLRGGQLRHVLGAELVVGVRVDHPGGQAEGEKGNWVIQMSRNQF